LGLRPISSSETHCMNAGGERLVVGLKKYFAGASGIRRTIREVMALAFWMHAFCMFGLIRLPFPATPDFLRYTFNGLLILFIVNYSLFTDNGWWSVFFDLGYIYSLPLVYVGRLCGCIWKLSFRSFKAKLVWQNPRLIPNSPAIVPQTGKTTTQSAPVDTVESPTVRFYHRFPRLFCKFTALWALFVLTVNAKPFLLLVIAVSLLGALKAIVKLWAIFSAPSNWIDKLEGGLAKQIEDGIKAILCWDGMSDSTDIRNTFNTLKLLGAVFNFVSDNSSMLISWAFTISVVVSVPFYCYISFLFSCVYFGIAKVASLRLALPEAFVDSLFMPFAWSALPSYLPIRFIGGLQATCVSIVGYNILFRHLGNQLERIAKAADSLHRPFVNESFKQKMSRVEDMLSHPNSASPKHSEQTSRRKRRNKN
jgi:hypothetical protein